MNFIRKQQKAISLIEFFNEPDADEEEKLRDRIDPDEDDDLSSIEERINPEEEDDDLSSIEEPRGDCETREIIEEVFVNFQETILETGQTVDATIYAPHSIVCTQFVNQSVEIKVKKPKLKVQWEKLREEAKGELYEEAARRVCSLDQLVANFDPTDKNPIDYLFLILDESFFQRTVTQTNKKHSEEIEKK